MKAYVRLGVVCLARRSFDCEVATSIYAEMQKDLRCLPNVAWEFIPQLVVDVPEARKAAEHLRERDVDGLVCISGTFHLGHLVLEMHMRVQKPILLWAVDEPPFDGGKIRLNSLCGMNLDCSNLYKAGVRSFCTAIGRRVDEDWVDAIRVCSSFGRCRVGLAGSHAPGFFNLDAAALSTYGALGVLVEHFELAEVLSTAIPESLERQRLDQVRSIFDVSRIPDDKLSKVARLIAQLDCFLRERELTALALRCWPELASTYGISPCAAMSVLQSEDRIVSCEGDVEGALTMVAQEAAGAKTPFLSDLSQVKLDDDTALLWHCGVAPCNLWDGRSLRTLDGTFAGGRGVTAGFVLGSGAVSVARIDSAGGDYRIFVARGRAIPMEKELEGTYVKVKFAEPVREVVDKVTANGVAHHLSVVYGDFVKPLRVFAKIKGWSVIE